MYTLTGAAMYVIARQNPMSFHVLVTVVTVAVCSLVFAASRRPQLVQRPEEFRFFGRVFLVLGTLALIRLPYYLGLPWLGLGQAIAVTVSKRFITALCLAVFAFLSTRKTGPTRMPGLRLTAVIATVALLLYYGAFFVGAPVSASEATLAPYEFALIAISLLALIILLRFRNLIDATIFSGSVRVALLQVGANAFFIFTHLNDLPDFIGHTLMMFSYVEIYRRIVIAYVHSMHRAAQAELDASRADRERLLAQLVTAQEAERKRISRELHDDVGQELTRIKAMLDPQALAGQDASELADRLRDVIGETLATVRRLARDLRPPALDEIGLSAALRSYIQKYQEAHGIETELQVLGQEGTRLAPGVEISLYRVFQEALTNVAKHSGATKLGILIDLRGPTLRAVIEDNGRGFDMGAARHGLGMIDMTERMTLIGGTISFESSPGLGTTVFLKAEVGGLHDSQSAYS